MKNKKGKIPYFKEIISAFIGLILIGALITAINTTNKDNCPTCDCSEFKNSLQKCQVDLENVTNELEDREVIYVDQTIEVPIYKTIEKKIYMDTPIEITIISISLILSLSLTLLSFKIRLPRRIEEKLERLERVIKIIKWFDPSLTYFIK